MTNQAMTKTLPEVFTNVEEAKFFLEEYAQWRCDVSDRFKSSPKPLPEALLAELNEWLNGANSWLGYLFQERRLTDGQIRTLMRFAKDAYEGEEVISELKARALRNHYDVIWFSNMAGWEPKTLDMVLAPFKDEINAAFATQEVDSPIRAS